MTIVKIFYSKIIKFTQWNKNGRGKRIKDGTLQFIILLGEKVLAFSESQSQWNYVPLNQII